MKNIKNLILAMFCIALLNTIAIAQQENTDLKKVQQQTEDKTKVEKEKLQEKQKEYEKNKKAEAETKAEKEFQQQKQKGQDKTKKASQSDKEIKAKKKMLETEEQIDIKEKTEIKEQAEIEKDLKAEKDKIVKSNDGNAYGKNKGELEGREFGQERATQAKLNKEKQIVELDKTMTEGEARVKEANDKISSAKEKLEKDIKEGKITDIEYKEKKENILKVEKAVLELEERVINSKKLKKE